jgi:hypothetical protein
MPDERVRKVQFHSRVQFKTIRHVSDFTEDEVQEGWYQKQDFMRMSEEVGVIAKMVAEGKDTHNGEEISVRGLEHLVEEDVADYRAEKMIASIDAVLDEQDDQRDDEINDPEAIAKIYSEIATPLLREAYLVGLRDAEEAQLASDAIDSIMSESASASDLEETKSPTAAPELALAAGDKFSPKTKKKKDQTPTLPNRKIKTKKTSGSKKPVSKDPPAPLPPLPPPPAKPESQIAPKPESQIAPKPEIQIAPKPKSQIAPKPFVVPAITDEGEELLNFEDEVVKSPKKTMSKEERKAAADARKSRDRTGKASEMSPLVRRRDGSFTFRNKGQESANAALKKERRDAVKDSLFKFLDSLSE